MFEHEKSDACIITGTLSNVKLENTTAEIFLVQAIRVGWLLLVPLRLL